MEKNNIATLLNCVPIVVRYVISGGTGAVVNIVTFFVLTYLFYVWYLYASIIAFISAFIVSFTLQRTWTFDQRTIDKLGRHTSLYLVATCVNTLLNTAIVFSLVEYINIWPIAAQIIAGLFVAVLSFFVYKRIFS